MKRTSWNAVVRFDDLNEDLRIALLDGHSFSVIAESIPVIDGDHWVLVFVDNEE